MFFASFFQKRRIFFSEVDVARIALGRCGSGVPRAGKFPVSPKRDAGYAFVTLRVSTRKIDDVSLSSSSSDITKAGVR